MIQNEFIIHDNDLVLITGANGFIGSKVLESLLSLGLRNIRCFVRPASNTKKMEKIMSDWNGKARIEVIKGNLLSRDDCKKAAESVSVVYHLAAGRGEKSYPDAFLNSVVTTRNLLDATMQSKSLKRFLLVSSFSVYSTAKLRHGRLLDENCEKESKPHLRGEAYCYAKVRQEELLIDYGKKCSMPYVIMRPGAVYGPGNKGIMGRVGLGTFGIFLHLGGSNRIPLSYVDNCADAIVLGGVINGVHGEIFNVVDDELPTSRKFLKLYKINVRKFPSVYIPRPISYLLCYLWEKYSQWSEEQLPPVFNRKRWASDWKGNSYSNEKIKKLLGWKQRISYNEALKRYFEYQRDAEGQK